MGKLKLKSPSQKTRHRLLLILFGMVVLGILFLWGLEKGLARNLRYRWYRTFNYLALCREIDQEINNILYDLGVPDVNISDKVTICSNNIQNWEFIEKKVHLPTNVVLVVANLNLTRAIEKCGAHIIEAEEFQSWDGNKKTLKMTLGFDEIVTHHLILEKDLTLFVHKQNTHSITLIFDELENNFEQKSLDYLLESDAIFNFAIQPNQKHSNKIAKKAKEYNKEILLSLPLEPKGYPQNNPGNETILSEFTKSEISQRIKNYIHNLPNCVGIINYKGSRATEIPEVMQAILQEAKKEHIYYIDTFASPRSVGWQTAHELGILTNKVSWTIDANQKPEFIEEQLQRLLRTAAKKKNIIALIHFHPKIVPIIEKLLVELETHNIDLIPASMSVE